MATLIRILSAVTIAVGGALAIGGCVAWVGGRAYLRNHAFDCGMGAMFGAMSGSCSFALAMNDWGPIVAGLGVLVAVAATVALVVSLAMRTNPGGSR